MSIFRFLYLCIFGFLASPHMEKYTLYKCLILPWLHNMPSINTICPLKKTQNIEGSITQSENLRFIPSRAKKSRITDKDAGLEGVEGRGKPNRQVLISFVTIGMIARNNFCKYFKDTRSSAVKTKIQKTGCFLTAPPP